jgi:hypothetical protein
VVHDRFRRPIRHIWLRDWYDDILLFLVRGCLRGYLKNQNLERVTAGFPKKRIFKKLAGFKLATTGIRKWTRICFEGALGFEWTHILGMKQALAMRTIVVGSDRVDHQHTWSCKLRNVWI